MLKYKSALINDGNENGWFFYFSNAEIIDARVFGLKEEAKVFDVEEMWDRWMKVSGVMF